MAPTAAVAQNKIHRLAIQVSDNNPAKMTEALNLAATVSQNYAEMGEQVEIEIVAFAGGLHMMRADTSPVVARLKSFQESMPNVSFVACSSTQKVMQKNEGKDIPIVDGAKHLPGVIRLIELNEKGWTIVRP
ncbi:MAG: hypothetical protein HY057_10620 [Rhodospirillales bacterium]|nr:hypothetical protein [Rhodospirillales bacterium]